jgi:hypothetical protein
MYKLIFLIPICDLIGVIVIFLIDLFKELVDEALLNEIQVTWIKIDLDGKAFKLIVSRLKSRFHHHELI